MWAYEFSIAIGIWLGTINKRRHGTFSILLHSFDSKKLRDSLNKKVGMGKIAINNKSFAYVYSKIKITHRFFIIIIVQNKNVCTLIIFYFPNCSAKSITKNSLWCDFHLNFWKSISKLPRLFKSTCLFWTLKYLWLTCLSRSNSSIFPNCSAKLMTKNSLSCDFHLNFLKKY